MTATKFELGRTVMTAAISAAIGSGDIGVDELQNFLMRHQSGDWGKVCESDAKQNDAALDPNEPERIMSVYESRRGLTVWVISEWTREVTTVLFPADY